MEKLTNDEIIVLNYLADGGLQNKTKIEISSERFYSVVKSLHAKNFVYEQFNDRGELIATSLTPAGQEALKKLNELNKAKDNQKCSVISNDELDLLYDRVLIKLPYFNIISYSEDIWNDCLPYLERLVNHKSPGIYISKIKNDLRALKETKTPTRAGSNAYKLKDLIAVRLYIILRYRFGKVDVYNEFVLPGLKEIVGCYNSQSYPFSNVIDYLNKVPQFNTSTILPSSITTDKRVNELETEIISLQKELNRVNDENTNLRNQIVSLKEDLIEPLEEKVYIDTGQGKKIKHHFTTAKKIVECIKKANKLSVMKKQEWEELLADITGLSKSTIHKYIR